ncbi:MAG: DUF3592 domain-containing protein [Gemmatimonadetes bacterium]|nr:DUF3592 domain-containing protein [Gemmatimonadota bacterium]
MPRESHVVEWIAIGLSAGFFALMGGLVLVSGIKDVWRAAASLHWPRVPAEVVRSEVTSEASRDSDGATNTMYRAQLLLAYEVNGQHYTTGRIRFGESLGSGDPSEPEMQRLRYPEGARVSVVYDPADPAVASARPGMAAFALVAPLAGIALLLGAALIILTGLFFLSNTPVLPLLFRLFVSAFILMGLAMGAAGARNLYFGWASRHWPTTDGEVVYQQGDQIRSRWRNSEGRLVHATSHATAIVYSYQVAGVTHFANNRRWGQLAGAGRQWAADIAARYPVGAAVTVRYDPVDPDRAALEPGFTSDVLWLPLIGLAFLLFGLAAWIWAIPAFTRTWGPGG